MEKRESLFQNKLFFSGGFVDARYHTLLSKEQIELANVELLDVAFKARHCSASAADVSDAADVSSESILIGDGTNANNLASFAPKMINWKKNWIYSNEEDCLNTSLQAMLLIR